MALKIFDSKAPSLSTTIYKGSVTFLVVHDLLYKDKDLYFFFYSQFLPENILGL